MLQLFFDGALAGQVLRLVFDTAALRWRHRSRVKVLATRQVARCTGRQSRSATLSTTGVARPWQFFKNSVRMRIATI
jgi:hypothetical protein